MKQQAYRLIGNVKMILADFHPDLIMLYTASAAWFIMLSFLPIVIVLLSLVRFIPVLQEDLLLNIDFVPTILREFLQLLITEIVENTSSFVLPIGALTGVLTASTGFASLIKGLNILYNNKESRPVWRARLMYLVYTVIFLFVLILVLLLSVFGKVLHRVLDGWFSLDISDLINWRLCTVVIILSLFFTLLYNTVPNSKSRWYNELPGAAVASCVWMLFSHIYSLYILNFDRFSKIYGSLTMIILWMIWLYACIFIVFIGAYINVLLQRYFHK